MPLINTKRVLIIGFSSIFLFMVLIAFFVTNQMRLTFTSIDHIVEKNNIKTTLISTMLVAARERTISLQKMLRLTDPFDRDDEWMLFNGHGARFADARKQFVDLGINEKEELILKVQGVETNKIAPMQLKIAELAINDDFAAAEKLLNTTAIPGQDRVFVQLYKLLSLLENESKLAVLHVSEQLENTKHRLMVAIALILLASILISIVVIRRIATTELILSREKERAQVTLNSIGDAVITTDAKGHVTSMNPVAEQLTAWSFDDARGQLLQTIFPIFDASSREPIDNPVEKVIATGETIFLSNHTTLTAKDGKEFHIGDSAAPIREKGNIVGMVLVFNDITEQYDLREAAAKSQRDLEAILDNSPAVVYVKSTDGCFTFINKEFENLFNIKCKDIIGKNLHDIFPKDIAEQMKANDQAVLAAGHAIESEEFAPLNDGQHTYVSIKFPLFDEDNNIYAVCGISTDVTERRRQDEQIRHVRKMSALGKLIGGIAHDYNNMLGIILGYAEQLDTKLTLEPALKSHAQAILRAAERGTVLTRKLLTFTQHKARDTSILNINDLLQEQQFMLEKTLTARIKLILDLETDLWPVQLDADELENVIINMSINAMQAIEGNGNLTLRTRNQTLDKIDAKRSGLEPGDYVLLSITDTGCGMDTTTKENIFDPFFSTKGEFGSGLGLSQVYGFIERSNASIKVYSELGRGSRFALFFPRSYDARITEQQTKTIDKNQRGSETLLVVDDEPDLRGLAQDILTTQGYHVLTANDGLQALAILKQTEVDLIISDVIMPNMDGYKLAAQVQQDYPHIKIQMVSGFADNRFEHSGDNSLHLRQLYKPYTSKALLANVRSLLDEDRA